jgi:membrane protease YdiL (CAAX protease family)
MLLPWLVSVVLAPVLEEVVFRHGLQATLAQRGGRGPVGGRGAWLANGLTALVFALAHVLVQQRLEAAAVVLPALAIGWVYQRTGRLGLCVALHAAMNALWLAGGQGVYGAWVGGPLVH